MRNTKVIAGEHGIVRGAYRAVRDHQHQTGTVDNEEGRDIGTVREKGRGNNEPCRG